MKFNKLRKILYNKISVKLFNLNLISRFQNMKKTLRIKYINLMILRPKKIQQKKFKNLNN